MNAPISILSLFLSLFCGVAFAQTQADSIRWAPDIVSAREAAAKFNVPLVVHFYGDGCLPCRTLEQRVFSQPEVISTMNRYFICVAVNGTKDPKIASEFAVHSWPTDVFLAPDGDVLYRGVSPQDVREFMGVLTNVAVTNRDRNLMLASQKATSESNATISSQPFSGTSLDNLKTSHPELAGLPRLGTQSESTTSTPNFYAASNQQKATQALATSASPRSDIQGGPAIPSMQPHAIHGPTATQLVQSPPFGTQSEGQSVTQSGGLPSNNIQASIASPATPLTAQQSQFSELPGLKATQPMRHAQDSQHRLANSPGIPTLESTSLPTSKTTQPGTGQSSVTNPFQLTSSVASAQQQSAISEPPTTTADTVATTTPALANEAEARVAASVDSEHPNLDGFCPVALRQQQWTPGNSSHAIRHRGKVYWMSNEAAVDAFLQRPDDFAPTLSGYDPQVLLYQGKLVAGSTQHGLFEANTGQVLLFSSQESKDEFQRNFEKNMRALTAVRQRTVNNPVDSGK